MADAKGKQLEVFVSKTEAELLSGEPNVLGLSSDRNTIVFNNKVVGNANNLPIKSVRIQANSVGATAGWYRVAVSRQNSSSYTDAILGISTSYSNRHDEHFVFAISGGHGAAEYKQITQLIGVYATHDIAKIRVRQFSSSATNGYGGKSVIDFYTNAVHGNSTSETYYAWMVGEYDMLDIVKVDEDEENVFGTLTFETAKGFMPSEYAEFRNKLLCDAPISTEAPNDDNYVITQGRGDYANQWFRRPFSLVWSYIKSKIASVLGLTETSLAIGSHTEFKSDGKVEMQYGSTYGSYNKALAYQSYGGLASGVEGKPYAQYASMSTLAMTVDGGTTYFGEVLPSASLTYTYDGTEHSYTNSSTYTQWIVIINKADFLGSGVFPFNKCFFIAGRILPDVVIASATELTEGSGTWQVVLTSSATSTNTYIDRTVSGELRALVASSSVTAYATAAGRQSTVGGYYSNTFGYRSATGAVNYANAFGIQSYCGNIGALAMGMYAIAVGQNSIAAGYRSYAKYNNSVALGYEAMALHAYANAFGMFTKTGRQYQTALGYYNEGKSDTLLEVGYGSSSARKNVFEVTTAGVAKATRFEGRLGKHICTFGTSYVNAVVLLCKVDAWSGYMTLVGKIFVEQNGVNRFASYDVAMHYSTGASDVYNSRFYLSCNSYDVALNLHLVQCTYNGEKWWALQKKGIQQTTMYFTGYDYNVSWEMIEYYNTNTSTVLNEEINSSIVNCDDVLQLPTKPDGTKAVYEDKVFAHKLATARTIDISGGAEATETSFDGSSNISIPITSLKESYLTWGGKNFSGSYSAFDACLNDRLNPNRFAFMRTAGISVEYSRDGGETWVDYEANNDVKTRLFNGVGTALYIGGSTETGIDKSAYMLRVTILTNTASIYTGLVKFIIDVCTYGSSGCYCTIQGRTHANYASDTDTWATFADKQPISGWSGFNVINTSTITTYGNSDWQYQQVRFTFGVAAHSASSSYAGLFIKRIFGYGGVGWTNPSTMAATGHLYSYDEYQNMILPYGLLPDANLSQNIGSRTNSFNKVYTRYIDTPSGYNLRLMSSGTDVWQVSTTGLKPTTTDAMDIGSASNRVKDIYAKSVILDGNDIAKTYIKEVSAKGGTLEIVKGDDTAEEIAIPNHEVLPFDGIITDEITVVAQSVTSWNYIYWASSVGKFVAAVTTISTDGTTTKYYNNFDNGTIRLADYTANKLFRNSTSAQLYVLLNGTLTAIIAGSAAIATRAIMDANSNIISNTYYSDVVAVGNQLTFSKPNGTTKTVTVDVEGSETTSTAATIATPEFDDILTDVITAGAESTITSWNKIYFSTSLNRFVAQSGSIGSYTYHSNFINNDNSYLQYGSGLSGGTLTNKTFRKSGTNELYAYNSSTGLLERIDEPIEIYCMVHDGKLCLRTSRKLHSDEKICLMRKGWFTTGYKDEGDIDTRTFKKRVGFRRYSPFNSGTIDTHTTNIGMNEDNSLPYTYNDNVGGSIKEHTAEIASYHFYTIGFTKEDLVVEFGNVVDGEELLTMRDGRRKKILSTSSNANSMIALNYGLCVYRNTTNIATTQKVVVMRDEKVSNIAPFRLEIRNYKHENGVKGYITIPQSWQEAEADNSFLQGYVSWRPM